MHISVHINSALALNKRDFKAPKCKGPLLNGPCRKGGAGGSNFPDALRKINVPHKCCTTRGNGDASNYLSSTWNLIPAKQYIFLNKVIPLMFWSLI